jgi:hypothetical protein
VTASPCHGARLQGDDVLLLALDVGQPILGMALDDPALERGITGHLAIVAAEEVADGEMAELVRTADLTDVEVMGVPGCAPTT